MDIFEPGEIVDVIGKSKGKGFAGTMKRHGFGGGPRTHGQSDRQRAPGSIGGGTTPGKVFKGLKMSGHMGNRRVTAKGLEVIRVDAERNLLMVKGGIPGAPNSPVTIRKNRQEQGVNELSNRAHPLQMAHSAKEPIRNGTPRTEHRRQRRRHHRGGRGRNLTCP